MDMIIPHTPVSFAKSPSIGTLAGALAKAQAEMRNPAFDRVNPHFKNRYATLSAHLDAVRGPLSKHGIALIRTTATPAIGQVTVGTLICHSSGEWLSCEMSAPCGQKIQEAGSQITYLRRYCLAAVLGIVGDEDDDGEQDRKARPQDARPEPRRSEPASEPVFSTADAKGLAKALASKGISLSDLRAAMEKAGLSGGEDVTTWPASWKPRIQTWIKGQPSRAEPPAEVDETA